MYLDLEYTRCVEKYHDTYIDFISYKYSGADSKFISVTKLSQQLVKDVISLSHMTATAVLRLKNLPVDHHKA